MPTDKAPKLNRQAAMRGAAALIDMLEKIGSTDGDGDKAIVNICVGAELDLDELVRYALAHLALQPR